MACWNRLSFWPENDRWWREMAGWLDYTHTWSISAIAAIAWVVIAYLFTNIVDNRGSNGQSVGSVWLWLLPIIVVVTNIPQRQCGSIGNCH